MEKTKKRSVNKLSCREKRRKRSVNKSASEGDISLESMLSLLNVSRINNGRRKAACRSDVRAAGVM